MSAGSLDSAALAFRDVPRVLPVVGDASLMAVRVGNDATGMPGNPSSHLGFPVAVEVCRGAAWLLALSAVTAVRERALPGQRTLPRCLHPGNAADRHRPLLPPTLCAGPPSRSVRAFTGHVSPPAAEPAAFHLSVRTFARTRDREVP